jgi:hypothetical protein
MGHLYRNRRRGLIFLNLLFLLLMNVCFHLVHARFELTRMVDALGLLCLLFVVLTFFPLHMRTGLWKLTHTGSDALDERQIQITHNALRLAYGWFTVIVLLILLVHAVYREVFALSFLITVPMVSSLIYLAHILPGTILAWTELEVPGESS